MKKQNLLIIVLLSISFSLSSQDIEYARYLLDTLCSPSMHGRGYVYKSDSIAADFIKTELEKNSIKPFNDNYFQKFSISVNTFPNNLSVKIGKIELIPGEDYLVSASSPSITGTYKIEILDAKILGNKKKYRKFKAKDHSKKFILIDTLGLNNPEFKDTYEKIVKKNILKAKGIIIINDKN